MHNSFIVADSSEAAAKEAGDVILSKVSFLEEPWLLILKLSCRL